MKSSMSVTFSLREKIIASGPVKKADALLTVLLVLEALLTAAYVLCHTVLIPNQTLILSVVRVVFLLIPLAMAVSVAVCNKAERLSLTYPTSMTYILMHLGANMALYLAEVMASLYVLLWWSAPILAILFMVAARAAMKGIITNDLYTTCEMWEAGDDTRFVLIDQKTPYFPDRKVVHCNRLILPMNQIRQCVLSENADLLEITSVIVAPSWQPTEEEYKDLESFNAFPTTPVKISMYPRSEKDRKTAKAFHDALQTWLA